MPRYIDTDKLINESKLDEFGCFDWSEVLAVITDEKLAPTEDVQPVNHGEWKELDYGGFYECSKCGYMTDYKPTKYCAECGSKMDKKEVTYIKDIFMTR